MKIAIFPNYGGMYIPAFLEEQLSSDDWIHQRVELANIIEKLEPTHNEITQDIYSAYVGNKPHELNFFDYIKDSKNPNVIYVKNLENKQVYMMKILNVNINRIWKINEYDGAERIEYFNKPEILEKDLNYGEW